jgi:hypothetical protein
MAIGPGKYDALCSDARQAAEAMAAILVIFEGNKGSGFSVQAPLEVTALLPAILRNVASMIEKDHEHLH